MPQKPPHPDHIEDDEEKHRRKWGAWIINNLRAFYAALKGQSVEQHEAELDKAIKQDFALNHTEFVDTLMQSYRDRLDPEVRRLFDHIRKEREQKELEGRGDQAPTIDMKEFIQGTTGLAAELDAKRDKEAAQDLDRLKELTQDRRGPNEPFTGIELENKQYSAELEPAGESEYQYEVDAFDENADRGPKGPNGGRGRGRGR